MSTVEDRVVSLGGWLRLHGRSVTLSELERAYRGRFTAEELGTALDSLAALGLAEQTPAGWRATKDPA